MSTTRSASSSARWPAVSEWGVAHDLYALLGSPPLGWCIRWITAPDGTRWPITQRPRCTGHRKDGHPCQHHVDHLDGYCRQHAHQPIQETQP